MDSRWILTLTLVPALLYSAAALACSPPFFANLEASPFATSDRIAFALSGDIGPDNVEFVVKEQETLAEIPGTKTRLDESNVLIFTPEEPLAVGGEYMVEFVELLGDEGIELFWVEIVEESPTATIASVTGEIHRADVENTCCSTVEGGCFDSCGGECFSCWPGAFEYRPGVLIEVTAGRIPVVINTFVYEEGKESTEEPRVFSRLGYQNVRLDNRLRGESEAGLCVRTVIRDLDNTVILESRDCVAAENFPAFEREVPDFPERVAQCAEAPENAEDINWQRYGEKSDVGGGCSTGGSPAGFGLVLFLGTFGMLLGFRRRVS